VCGVLLSLLPLVAIARNRLDVEDRRRPRRHPPARSQRLRQPQPPTRPPQPRLRQRHRLTVESIIERRSAANTTHDVCYRRSSCAARVESRRRRRSPMPDRGILGHDLGDEYAHRAILKRACSRGKVAMSRSTRCVRRSSRHPSPARRVSSARRLPHTFTRKLRAFSPRPSRRRDVPRSRPLPRSDGIRLCWFET
jgi:hypothetical protein